MTDSERSPRHRLHHQIRQVFSNTVANYYKANLDKLRDPEIEQRVDEFIKVMLAVLAAIDEYQIENK
jgi:hypothetical protein